MAACAFAASPSAPLLKLSVATRLPGALSSVNSFEQQILGSGGQERQQAFGNPGGGLVGVESGPAECGGPVLSKIDGHEPQVGGGQRASPQASRS